MHIVHTVSIIYTMHIYYAYYELVANCCSIHSNVVVVVLAGGMHNNMYYCYIIMIYELLSSSSMDIISTRE